MEFNIFSKHLKHFKISYSCIQSKLFLVQLWTIQEKVAEGGFKKLIV